MIFRNIIKPILIFGFVLILNACATIERPISDYPKTQPTIPTREDTVHIVAPGENLSLISQMYDVSLDTIMQANNLSSHSKLYMGRRLLIPKALPIKSVIPLFPSKKWRYIIVHHSATDEGNALSFHHAHQLRGFDSLGYHFVIDNGTSGKKDGHIECSGRWLGQKDGAHCKANDMNTKGIGICLVGNFSKDKVSEKQFSSLIYLIKVLKKYYEIPISHILGHGQVRGAKTECPGSKFPLASLKRKLQEDAER